MTTDRDDSSAAGRDIVQQLIDLTPEPRPDGDAERLLGAFQDIVARRAEIIAHIVPPLRLADVDRPLLAELERRQNLWQDALAEALRSVGEQRTRAAQLRSYAPPP
jgi:hypothetical protein